MATIHKVVAYITFERRLLVFEHVRIPEAAVQILKSQSRTARNLKTR